MTATTEGTARLTLDILDHINGCDSDEEAIGAISVLMEFLNEIKGDRTSVYWEGIDWERIPRY
jgi:hypothetical protein